LEVGDRCEGDPRLSSCDIRTGFFASAVIDICVGAITFAADLAMRTASLQNRNSMLYA
jgi:hypothetical protein